MRALNSVGGGVYSFTQTVPFCWKEGYVGSTYTSWVSSSGPAVVTATVEKLFWQYNGVIDQQVYRASGNPYHTYYVQGHFSLCFGPWCVQHTHPWISIGVAAWGDTWADGYPGVG